MRLVIERGELLRALGHVTSVVERRTTIPILSNVLLRVRKSTLEFKATDLEREVIEGVAADVAQPGAVTVPAHMLHDIVRKLPDGSQVDIRKDAEKERLTLAAGHARFALQTLPAEDFPDIGVGEMGQEFELDRAGSEAAHRQDALCHLDGRDALLPQRHLPAHRAVGQQDDAARRGDRRPSLGAGRAAAAEGRREHARRHHSAQDRARAAIASSRTARPP